MAKYFLLLFFILKINCAFAADYFSPPINFPQAKVINDYTTRIPFKLVDHLIIVEAELLNQKGGFIIDTGSERLILNKVHFNSLYEFQRKKNSTSGVIQSIDNPYEKTIKDFNLNDFKIENKMSDIIDLSHIENIKKTKILGIVGYTILKDYEVFIDLHLNQITLTEIDKFGNKLNEDAYLEKIADSLDFSLINHTIVVNATINGEKARLGLDTAAEFNQINKSVNKKTLEFFVPQQRLKLTGAGNKTIRVLAGKLHRVKLSSSIYLGPMNTVLTNLNKMNDAFGTQLDGILGYEFFVRKRTIINYKKEKLYFINHPIVYD